MSGQSQGGYGAQQGPNGGPGECPPCPPACARATPVSGAGTTRRGQPDAASRAVEAPAHALIVSSKHLRAGGGSLGASGERAGGWH